MYINKAKYTYIIASLRRNIASFLIPIFNIQSWQYFPTKITWFFTIYVISRVDQKPHFINQFRANIIKTPNRPWYTHFEAFSGVWRLVVVSVCCCVPVGCMWLLLFSVVSGLFWIQIWHLIIFVTVIIASIAASS